MLDNITKRRIDNCRDILVGKLPDPKSQIEQITIALIYKFMDDMDKEAIELGGKAKFFSDYTLPDPNNPEKQIIVPFEKYSWDNLFDTKVNASEMLKLYSEAIEGMVKNPNIPDLFANIFKNAYLPYRDPETLKMFLKTISEFEYTHSEKLGDAFEYLLSVMGSQGDAGQFRTPRHIIDFLVAAVDPGKNDTILDPACGTAGFLISAFKHIKQQNNNTLTPDEQKKLIKNFVGYDISPDMVRLSLVNLYLHGFSDPHIFEYDSLSSEQRWDETFDVVLANPPFMSPKGGIRPHKKFTISSNRSEVLFVDYIAEHLNPKGKAGIIVPEGIIFQSGTAYKALRKMLVEKYLYAVVSLPAGVFNPYSGVKTSILLMDADLAKKTKDILFVKIDNDGYGLGAQRNAVKGGQLEEAVETLKTFRQNCNEGKFFENTTLAQVVSKTVIGKSDDYNLSGERYKISQELSHVKYDIVSIGDVFKTSSGGTPLKKYEDEFYKNGTIPWLRSGEVAQGYIHKAEIYITDAALKESSAKLFPVDTVLVAMYGATAGQVGILKFEASTNQAVCGIFPNEKAIPEYLYLIIKSQKEYLISLSGGGAQPNISQKIIRDLKIPLPALSVQKEIVAEIESYQNEIERQKKLIINYEKKIKDRIGMVWGEKEQIVVSEKLSNDLYIAMMLKQMERKIQLNYGEVATQKTVFHLNTFTNQKLDYPFMNSNYGTYSYQLKDDLLKNPYLTKTKKGNGEVFVVTSSKENEVLEALSNPDNKDFVNAINEVLNIYQSPLINKETENIELLNTVSKVILDKQTSDLEAIYKGMENWEINQNGYKTKADKFTKAKTKKMIGLIDKLGLTSKLLKK